MVPSLIAVFDGHVERIDAGRGLLYLDRDNIGFSGCRVLSRYKRSHHRDQHQGQHSFHHDQASIHLCLLWFQYGRQPGIPPSRL